MTYYKIGNEEFNTLEEAKEYQRKFGGIIMGCTRTA